MKRLAAAATAFVLLATPAAAWTGGPTSEAGLNKRIEQLQRRKDEVRDAIRNLKQRTEDRVEQKRERVDRLRHKIRIFKMQDGWVGYLVELRDCESHSNYQEGPNEGIPGYTGAYQYDRTTWGGAWGYSYAYLAPWYYQDALTAQYLENGEHGRWPNCP